jgi:hypothetical protein
MSSTTTFPVRRVNTLRRAAACAARFPDQSPEGWSKSPVDPMDMLGVFDALRLKPGFVLRAYSFFDGGNGNAVVYAMPADAPFPAPEACPRKAKQFLEPPIPPGAFPQVMRYIEGDGSPWSYMSASVFVRELAEFGARWHGCDWSTHTILGANPVMETTDGIEISDPESWTWLAPAPKDWRPGVAERAGRITVAFYTYAALGNRRVIRHADRYRRGTYRFTPHEAVIAEGGQGFVF